MAGVGVLLVGASVALHVEAIEDIKKKRAKPVVQHLRKAFKRATGEAPKMHKKIGPCVEDPACVEQVKSKTGAADVAFVTIEKGEGGKWAIALTVDLIRGNGAIAQKTVTLRKRKKKWKKILDGMMADLEKQAPPSDPAAASDEAKDEGDSDAAAAAGATAAAEAKADPPADDSAKSDSMAKPDDSAKSDSMAKSDDSAKPDKTDMIVRADPPKAVPSPAPAAPITDVVAEAEPASGPNLLPWVVIGASVVTAGVGVVFGISSSNARRDAEDNRNNPEQLDMFNDRLVRDGVIANVLYGLSAAGAAAGVTLLVLD